MRYALLPLALLALAGCAEPTTDATAAGTAGPEPVPILVAEGGADAPTVALDARDGAAVVAWAQTRGDTTDVWATRVLDGERTAPARVNAVRGTGSAHPQAPPTAAVAPDGTVYVVWVEQVGVPGRRFPASDLRLARSDDGGRTFGPTRPVNPDAGFPTGHTFHSVAVGPDGAVYVAWLDGTARDRARQSAPSAPSGGAHPAALHDQHGHGTANEVGTELVVARSTDGGQTFEAPIVVVGGTCECCRVALAVGSDGAVSVAWRHQFEGGVRDIALARSTDGARTFSAPARVRADGWQIDGCPHAGPALAAAPGATPHVIWYTGAEAGRGVYHAGPDGRPTAVLPGTTIAQVAAASDGEDGAWLAWEDPGTPGSRLAHQRADGKLSLAGELSGKTPWLAAAGRRWAATYARDGSVWLRTGGR